MSSYQSEPAQDSKPLLVSVIDRLDSCITQLRENNNGLAVKLDGILGPEVESRKTTEPSKPPVSSASAVIDTKFWELSQQIDQYYYLARRAAQL